MSDTLDATGHIAEIIEGLDPGALVTRFVVIAEVIDAEGERAIWTDTSDGSTRWDTYGLLTYALEEERSNHHISAMIDRDVDE